MRNFGRSLYTTNEARKCPENFTQFFAQFFAQTSARVIQICRRYFALGNVRPAGTPPPSCTPFCEGARGKGPRLERESRLVAFSNCGRFGRGNTTSRVPGWRGIAPNPSTLRCQRADRAIGGIAEIVSR